MAPKNKCVNCGAADWLHNDRVSYIPEVTGRSDTRTDTSDGLHVVVWMCKSCWYLMPFGSRD